MSLQARSLLSSSDVVRFANLGASFPRCDVRDIFQIEQSIFRDCFTSSFYDNLKKAVADYSSAQIWTIGNTQKDVVVSHRGFYWIALKDTTTEPISENEYWALAPKFDNTNPCGKFYNIFWCIYLAPYLSTVISLHTAKLNSVVTTSSGIVVKTGDGFTPASSSERASFYAAWNERAEIFKRNMDEFVKTHGENCIPKQESECGCDAKECTPRAARYIAI